ncbi:MAG: polymer-forming cytoskeletal protein [Oscillospiraceae bacterium]|nr:polymer-forming cytoskeletal protein [Oscillospiraceae bacterium]
MGIKDNFSQAVKELWKKDGQEQNPAASGAQPSELERYLQQEDSRQDAAEQQPDQFNQPTQPDQSMQQNQPAQPMQSEQPAPNAYGEPVQPAQQGQPARNVQAGQFNPDQTAQSAGGVQYNQSAQSDPSQGGMNMNAARAQGSQAAPQFGGQSPMQTNMNGYNGQGGYGGFVPPEQGGVSGTSDSPEVDETTVISKNTIIDGNVRSLANMQIDGNIKGNIETTRNIDMTGKVVGDITCNNAGMSSAAMQGNVTLKGRMKMDRDTILIGDLSSQYADVNGRIRGKLDITGRAELKRDAIVFGDINASTIAVTDGAIIQGYVNTTFLSKEDSRSAIPEAITFDSKD